MRKVGFITVIVTLALAIPFITLVPIEIAYLTDYVRSIGGAMTGVMDWHSVALEDSARWPELAGMIVGQLLILSILLIARRHKPDSDPDLFGRDPPPQIQKTSAAIGLIRPKRREPGDSCLPDRSSTAAEHALR